MILGWYVGLVLLSWVAMFLIVFKTKLIKEED